MKGKNTCDADYLNVLDGVFEPGTTTQTESEGSCKRVYTALFDPWLQIDYLTNQWITTVYVMGSLFSDTAGDLDGVELFVY